MSKSPPATVPLIPFSRGSVLLPSVAHRLTVPATRPDIPAIIAAIYQNAANSTSSSPAHINSTTVVCVPHRSPLIGPDGQLLIQDGTDGAAAAAPPAGADDAVDKDDFFGYATAARIVGFDGGAAGELSLVVEGMGRVKMGKVSQDTPFYEGEVEYLTEDVPVKDSQLRDLFTLLKARATELIAVHVSSLVSRPYATNPLHVANIRKVGVVIKGAQLKDSGSLADLMTSVIDSTYEEKLQVLATLDVKTRVVKVIELLERQVDELKNLLKAAALATMPVRIVSVSRAQTRRPMPPLPGEHDNPFLPPGPNSGWDDGASGEPSELDELRKKLEAAKLSPDAGRMAARELRKLQKMVPANQEYQVIRNWLETLSEIPWARTTDDRLDKGTLTRARRQLDDDHYGLESVKKRLIEYLAVLRLKQSVSDEVDAQISQLEQELKAEGEAEGSEEAGAQDAAAAVTTTTTTTQKSRQVLQDLKNRKAGHRAPILLLAGPPGVGKTSLARSVAAALGRKFHRISLGGVRDEAEIRGHRRTYIAAMPGAIVQALRKVGVANPVILLDEIDKLSTSGYHGDPSAAMLEVLDPEQNHAFTDHYVNTPVDLSRVLFIATANNPDTIPPPLLDRLENIPIPGYTPLEKRHIALQHLVPKQVHANGLAADQATFDADVVARIIESYTRESGVRNLEREIASVCRSKAVEYAEARDGGGGGGGDGGGGGPDRPYRARVTVEDVERILGPERYEEEIAAATSRPGVVTGLVAYNYGGTGSILFVEVADMPGDGKVQLTGRLGSVLQESVSVALSWVKAHAFDLGLTQDPAANIMQDRSIHVHCPSGAVPKDGPSSGIAQAIALISLFSGKPVPPTMAMTGEISLRGRIMAVGGIKEKLIGALRAGVKTVILPAQNRKDVRDLPREVKSSIEIYPVSHVWEAVRLVWPDWKEPADHTFTGIESRL